MPEAYIVDQLEARFEATEKANAWLSEQLGDLEAKVRESERAVEIFREDKGLSEVSGGGLLDRQLSELNSQLIVAQAELAEIEARTRKAGGEIVGLLGSGSAFVSPALSALEMVEAIAFDKRKITPVCALLQGEYGVDNLFVGVPVILGKNGIEQVVEIDLDGRVRSVFGNRGEGPGEFQRAAGLVVLPDGSVAGGSSSPAI